MAVTTAARAADLETNNISLARDFCDLNFVAFGGSIHPWSDILYYNKVNLGHRTIPVSIGLRSKIKTFSSFRRYTGVEK